MGDLAKKLLQYVNLRGLLIEWLLESVVKPKLQELVDDTSTPWDNTLLDIVYPKLVEAAEKELEKLG
jgi:hypothetical protein